MNKNCTVVFVTPEMMIPELGDPAFLDASLINLRKMPEKDSACDANFRGGLGILAGDLMEGLAGRRIQAVGITPFYRFHWMTGQEVNYRKTPAQPVMELTVKINQEKYKLQIMRINRGGTEVYGLYCSDVFDYLYTGDMWKRLRQEVLIGHAVPALLKAMEIKPDIIWLQEGHTSIVGPVIKTDSYFQNVKILFTTHTPAPEGLETFYANRFPELGIASEHKKRYVRGNDIDMTRGIMELADWITAVSEEHGEIVKTELFPEFAHKISAVMNGTSREIWLSSRIKALEIEGRVDPRNLWEAHLADKAEFLEWVERESRTRFDPSKPLLGWVRRFCWFKNLWPMLEPILRAVCAERGTFVETRYGRLEGLGIQFFGAGRAHERDEGCKVWMREFKNLMEGDLRGSLVFLPTYGWRLRRDAAGACDIWLSCPMPRWEACGTSDHVASQDGNINVATPTGGPKHYIRPYNPVTREGNGFHIWPYEPLSIYRDLKIISDLYYAFIERGNLRLLEFRKNIYESAKTLDIVYCIERYEKIFQQLLNP